MDKGAKVTVYGTRSCPWCDRAKEFLEGKGALFVYKDVGADPAAYKEMMEKSGQGGVPVLEITGRIIVGFDEAAIMRALGA